MTKTRKEKVIEELKNHLEKVESILIETPEKMGNEEYEKLISEAKQVRETLRFLERL